MAPIQSRPMTTIVSPPSSYKSRRNRAFDSPSDRKARGYTGRNTIGKVNKAKVTLDQNPYYTEIMDRIEILSKDVHNGRNRLISLDNLRDASKEMLCKECVEEAIVKERQKTSRIIVEHLEKHNKKVSLTEKVYSARSPLASITIVS